MLSYSRRGTCADPQNRYPCFYIPESTALQQARPVRKPPTFVSWHYTNTSRTTSSIVFTNTISMPFVISKEITKGMEIVFVKTMDDVVREAFA